ncbi:MAG TPA: serine hydrolase domain-containing protein [Aquihabitans sp.]|nr:serine hydrolase domain-containing protein [Aquihabitans sp.]
MPDPLAHPGAVTGAGGAPPAAGRTRAGDAALVDALLAIGRWEAPHASAAVAGPDGTTATAGDPDRAFRLASVTKLLTAYACLVAIEEGTLDLDGPAGPEGATVRHLLAHAAGYGFDTGPMGAPGRRRTYSNTGFEALARHLAVAAGMEAADYVIAAVVEPLGLRSTDLRDGSLAHGAWSTAADLGRLATELLRPTLVHADTLAEATTVQFPGLAGPLPGVGPQDPNDWGLGFELRDHKAPHWTGSGNSPATFGHFGASGTFLWVDPAIDVGLAVLTDRDFGPWALVAWPPLADAVVDAHR